MLGIYTVIALNSVLFLSMSFIHVYWAFGGQWGTEGALPSRDGKRVLNPRPIGTLGVAIVLMVFAICSAYALQVSPYLPLIIGILFGLRTIGDFRFVGLFKQIRNTTFASYDNRFFIPLCTYISGSNLFLYWYLVNLL